MNEPPLRHRIELNLVSSRGEGYQELENPDGGEREPIQQPGFQDIPLNFRITSFCMFCSALKPRNVRRSTASPSYELHRVVPPECVEEPGLGPIQVKQECFGQRNENWIACPWGSERIRRRVNHSERSGAG